VPPKHSLPRQAAEEASLSDERMICFTENEAWSIAFALADAAELAHHPDVQAISHAARFEQYYQWSVTGPRRDDYRELDG
jgi:hypothetical protein